MLLLTLFGIWCFVTAVVGSMAGLVLGNLRLPVALLLAPTGPASAANLVISAVTALSSTVEHLRAHRVVWRLFWLVLVPSVVGAVLGGLASGALPEKVVLGVVAVVLLVSAVGVYRKAKAEGSDGGGSDGDQDDDPDVGGKDRAAVLGGSLVIGAVGGLIGLVLGALRTPLLLKYAGGDAAKVAATNVAVGLFVSLAGLVGHVPNGAPDLGITIAGCIGSIPGGVLGARLTGKLDRRKLLLVIAGVLVVAAVSTGVQAFTG